MVNNTLREGDLDIVRIKHVLELAVEIPIQAKKIIIFSKRTKPHIDCAVAVAHNKKLWRGFGQNTIIIRQR